MKRIIKIPKGMKWGEFRKKYSKFFPISNAKERNEKLKSEFKRLKNEMDNANN